MTLTSAPSTSPTVTDAPYAVVAERLRATFASGRTRSYEWRVEQLRGLDRLLTERKQDIQRALGEDLRRTPFEAALFDISATRGEVKHAVKHLARWMKPRKVHAPVSVRPGKAWYQYEPLGVVLIIGPWNYPVHLTLTPLVAAFAAGNCAVIKPSEVTPACSRLLAEILPRVRRSGCDRGRRGRPRGEYRADRSGAGPLFLHRQSRDRGGGNGGGSAAPDAGDARTRWQIPGDRRRLRRPRGDGAADRFREAGQFRSDLRRS